MAPPIVLMGHSMGGAVAVHVAHSDQLSTVVGLVVIDVVEGTALGALASMQSFLRGRPQSFLSLEDAIRWRYAYLFITFLYFGVVWLFFWLLNIIFF